MPETQPSAVNVPIEGADDPKAGVDNIRKALKEFERQLNYIFKDIYHWFDIIRGIGNYTFNPVNLGGHDHQSDTAGGDYPWADIVAQDVSYIQALVGSIVVSNLLDKSASEEIAGTYKLTALTAERLLALNASKEIIIRALESHIVDASTSHAITDPADTPADADALRDDLVANTIPSIESALDALGTQMNLILTALENTKILNTS